MDLIRTIRERQQTKREDDIHRLSEELITLADFDSTLYIAYQGTPLIPLEASCTSEQIVQELAKVRRNFVSAKMKNIC